MKIAHSHLTYDTSDEIRNIISSISRTEDVKLSPNNQKLIILDFLNNKFICLSIKIDTALPEIKVGITDYLIITSDALKRPHGITFLDEQHIAIANRLGDVSIFELPAFGKQKEHHTSPIFNIAESTETKIKTPGSIASYKDTNNHFHLLVCNNFANSISSHHYDLNNQRSIKNNGLLIDKGLKTPDGICVSPDNNWFAISNHDTGEVLLYKNSGHLLYINKMRPKAKLGGMVCPHGVRFTADGNSILIADAGSPFLHVFISTDGDWHSSKNPNKSIRLVPNNKFIEGRYNPMEGGIKGIDITNDSSVLITTNEKQPLAFLSIKTLMQHSQECVRKEIKGYCAEKIRHQKRHKPQSKYFLILVGVINKLKYFSL